MKGRLDNQFKEFCTEFLDTAFLHMGRIRVYDDGTYVDAIIFNSNHPDHDMDDENGDPIYLKFTLAEYVNYILNMEKRINKGSYHE